MLNRQDDFCFVVCDPGGLQCCIDESFYNEKKLYIQYESSCDFFKIDSVRCSWFSTLHAPYRNLNLYKCRDESKIS